MRQFGPIQLTDSDYTRLLKVKDADGFRDKPWVDWLRYKSRFAPLEDNLDEAINKVTSTRLPLWMQNFAQNLTLYRADKDIGSEPVPLGGIRNAIELLPSHLKEVPMDQAQPVGPAIVIGRGPSIWKQNHLGQLRAWAFLNPDKASQLTILSTDGMLLECLKADITPSRFPNFYVLSIDGDRKLILKWFGDDTDPSDTHNVEMFNKHAAGIKMIAGSTVANNVVRRCLGAGSEVYLFHPIFDDALESPSFTRMMMYMTETKESPPFFGVHSLGNAGGLAWVLSWILLRTSPCLLIGLDYGYLPETKVEDTAYASKALNETNDLSALRTMMELENPYDHVKYKTDGVFVHYRKSFIDVLEENPPPKWVRILNCTEGGNLWGNPRIEWTTLKEGLAQL